MNEENLNNLKVSSFQGFSNVIYLAAFSLCSFQSWGFSYSINKIRSSTQLNIIGILST